MKSILSLVLCVLALGLFLPAATAQSPDLIHEDRDMVRVMRHADGTKSVYKRQANWKGMRCATYTASGKLAAIHDYTEGKYGQLVGCIIYNDKREVIYKVSYGYDAQARLIEERMFTTKGKLVQRVIYRYDAEGKRSKPLIVSLNSAVGEIRPTMGDGADQIHKEMRGSGRSR